MSWPSVSVCLVLGASCSASYSVCSSRMVVRTLGLTCPAVFWLSTCVVVPCGCRVFVALLAWHCGFYYSLAVLFDPFLPLFLEYIYVFFPSEPFGLSMCVTSACWGPGAGGSWLGCVLGRPVGCSSALGI